MYSQSLSPPAHAAGNTDLVVSYDTATDSVIFPAQVQPTCIHNYQDRYPYIDEALAHRLERYLRLRFSIA
ncbi:hypothetical protein D3C74_439430 [compost metagenome]